MDLKNIHEGHRERTIKKFLKNPAAFSDHEVLEVLLFFALPRKDTNALAHRILNVFGSVDGVFNASACQLEKIDGVGKRLSAYILSIGQLFSRLALSSKVKDEILNTPEKTKLAISPLFYGQNFETFVMVLLDKNYRVIAKSIFCDKDRGQVSAEIPEIITAIEAHKPKFMVIAHNHPSFKCLPSNEDDFTTKKINVLCELYDVVLSDHLIFAGDNVYSYKQEGRLDEIRRTAVLNKLFDKIKEN